MNSRYPLLLYSAFDTLELGIILLNQRGEIVLWNHWLERASGLSADQVAGLRLVDACPELQHSRLIQALEQALHKNLSATLSQSLNKAPFNLFRAPQQQGDMPTRMQQAIHITPLPQYNDEQFALIQIHDVTNSVMREEILQERAESLRRYAYQDELTGVPNRTFFNETLQNLWRLAGRQGSEMSILIIDLDHFTRFNEQEGHLAGDQCLQKIAKALQSTLRRPEDLIARFGGDKLVLLLPYTPLIGAKNIGLRLLDVIHQLQIPYPQSPTGHVSASIGCASCIASHELDPSYLVQEAELAVFFAKQNGRNQVRDSQAPLKNTANSSSPDSAASSASSSSFTPPQ